MGNRLTMGNFFSGSGTWELAAKICGIDVLFESEIEPFPVALEAKRFPEAIQLGDVSKVNGAEIPPVDIMTNSSPCQDLSVAGKRAGLDGERSGLFMEVIRITKEMRNADRLRSGRTTEYLRPRFWCWENVPGALSSAGGADFKTVLEEVIGIVEPETHVPMPKKWGKAGVVDGDNWQLAWRIMDSQWFGVPQRRRRLYVAFDTFGHSAGEILFERESVSWHFAEIAQAWQRTSLSFEERIDIASRIVNGELRTDSRTLEVAESGIDSGDDSEVFGMNEPVCFDGSNVTNPINASNPKPGDPCHTLSQDSRNYVVEKN